MEPITTAKLPAPFAAPRYQPLVIVLAAVAAGIFCDAKSPLAAPAWWAIAAAGWSAWLLLWRGRHDRSAGVVLWIALAALGGAWHHCRWCLFADDELGIYAREAAQPTCVEAVVVRGPRRVPAPPYDPLCAIQRGDQTRLEVDVTRLRDGEAWRPASGRVKLWVEGHLLGVHAGDRLRVVGQVSAPTTAHNPGEFDFARHARADRQLCRVSADFPECVEIIERPAWWGPARIWEELRGRGDAILWQRLAHQRSGLAAALLLGIREELDTEATQAFSKTGTIHLLSISGLHVGILASFLFWAMRLRWAGRGFGLAAIALVTLGYALVIDAEPPAARATVVVLLVCAARYWWRRLPAFNALALAALWVLWWNPAELFRVGPQLSFLAMAALVWFGPRCVPRPSADPLDRLIARTRPWHEKLARWSWRSVAQATALTACVWAVSAPVVMAQFHLVSPATLVLTPLLALPVALGLMSGFAVLVLDWVFPPLGAIAGSFCDASLWAVEGAVETASHCPGSHFWVPGPEPWWLWVFYAALAILAAAPRLRPPARWCLALMAGWSAVGLAAPLLPTADEGRLDCTFLSVGHGCAVVLELPDGQTLLYDAGRLGSPAAGARTVSGYLWSRGITHVDAIVLSHADVDHYNAVPELLEKFSVGVVYATPAMLADEGPAIRRLRRAIDASGVPLSETWAGDRLRVSGGCNVEVLHPTRRGVLGSDNANSLVLAVEHAGRRILLTGDLETPGLDDVIAESALDCDVILAPHHGSSRSNPPGFAAWSTPDWVVISGSHSDKQGEAEAAYHASGAQVLDTADVGAVRVTIADDKLTVATRR